MLGTTARRLFGLLMLVYVLILGVTPSAHASTVVTFGSPSVESAVRDSLHKYEGDITDEDMLGVTNLFVGSAGSLEGVQYAKNLVQLHANDGTLSDLTPLMGLTKLRVLRLWNSQISDLTPLAGLHELEVLALSNNRITDITPLRGLTSLTELYLGANQISDISALSGLNKVWQLYLNNNQIYDLSGLPVTGSAGASLGSTGKIVLTANNLDLSPGSSARAKVDLLTLYGWYIQALPQNFCTVQYAAGEGGSISGVVVQHVSLGGDTSSVSAVPATGFQFLKWSDGLATPVRTDTNVTADKLLTALFAHEVYTLTYLAGPGGYIWDGPKWQRVAGGADGERVWAEGSPGYRFVSWSDGVTECSRVDTGVVANLQVTARFERIPLPSLTGDMSLPVAPSVMYRGRFRTIYQRIHRPEYYAGFVVRFRFYKRNSSGKYVYHHSVTGRRTPGSPIDPEDEYTVFTSLPHSGRWRVRVYHVCQWHSASYSGYDYITVK